MFEKIYGQQIEVHVTGKIIFQVPAGMPDQDGNTDRSDTYVIQKVNALVRPAAGWDELDIKVVGRTFGELIANPGTRELVRNLRRQYQDDTIATKKRLPKDPSKCGTGQVEPSVEHRLAVSQERVNEEA